MKLQNRKLFNPYFPFGYPTLPASVDVIEALAKNGADVIEIGMSFSDPLADGPVIQQATQAALNNGVTIAKTFAAVKELRQRGVETPLVLMGYYNPLLAYGLKKFVADCQAVQIAGLIIPDLPIEEAGELRAVLGDIPLIQMIAPTTPPDRIAELAANAGGFIYLVSFAGITGSGHQFSQALPALITEIRKHTKLAVCIGFGVNSTQKAVEMAAMADGVFVGTHLVREAGTAANPAETAARIAREFRAALDGK